MASSPPEAGRQRCAVAAWWMRKKKPCCFCRKWFRPDPRVGSRQKSCSHPECQKKRRHRTQANWRKQNPDYSRARWMRQRSDKAAEADKAKRKPLMPGRARPRRPAPIRAEGLLRQIPWSTMQDEIGVQVTDSITVVALLLTKAMQDQRRLQSTGNKGEPRALQASGTQDQIQPVSG